MALSEEQKQLIIDSALANRRTSVDGLSVERRSISELREALELIEDVEDTEPSNRFHISSFIPPGSLDG